MISYPVPRLITVAGINIGLTSLLHRRLKEVLPGSITSHQFAFAGNPFHGNPHPLLWNPDQKNRVPCARLFDEWADLTDFLVRLRPNLDAGKVVVTHRLGLDALLYAIAQVPAWAKSASRRAWLESENQRAEHMHHDSIVPGIVKALGFPLPLYLILQAEPAAVTKDWLKRSPSLRDDFDCARLKEFIAYENEAIGRYFNGTGQRPPIILLAHLSIDEMVELAISAIRRMLNPPKVELVAAG